MRNRRGHSRSVGSDCFWDGFGRGTGSLGWGDHIGSGLVGLCRVGFGLVGSGRLRLAWVGLGKVGYGSVGYGWVRFGWIPDRVGRNREKPPRSYEDFVEDDDGALLAQTVTSIRTHITYRLCRPWVFSRVRVGLGRALSGQVRFGWVRLGTVRFSWVPDRVGRNSEKPAEVLRGLRRVRRPRLRRWSPVDVGAKPHSLYSHLGSASGPVGFGWVRFGSVPDRSGRNTEKPPRSCVATSRGFCRIRVVIRRRFRVGRARSGFGVFWFDLV